MKEIWRKVPVEPFGKVYAVSNIGRIMRYKKGKYKKPYILKPFPYGRNSAYLGVEFNYKGKRERHVVHLLVALAFLGPKPEGYEVNHKDTDKRNNNKTNLEYLTPKENTKHAIEHGKFVFLAKGEDHHKAKLSKNRVIQLRKAFERKPTYIGKWAFCIKMSERLGVTPVTIGHIINYKTWRDIT